ncbi:MAG: response regulator [Planctomycetota bacterium]
MKKILIADDEKNIRKILREVVEGLGCEATLAENGQEAFRAATSNTFDLILLDIMMPEWNGVDAIKSLDFINKKPKVIVISGYVSPELQGDLKSLENVAQYISKPFQLGEVREAIRKHLG